MRIPRLYSRLFLGLIFCALIRVMLGCAPYEKIAPYPYSLHEPAIIADTIAYLPPGDWLAFPADSPSAEKVYWDRAIFLPFDPSPFPGSERPFYAFVNGSKTDTLYLSNRYLEFDEVLNFRDLGGIRTIDGRQVKWGKIYRSGHLGELKKRELAKLESLQINYVVDLRTPGEQEHHPDKIPAESPIQWVSVSVKGINYADIEQTKSDIRKQNAQEFDGSGRMTKMMDTIAKDGTQDFRQVFNLLLNDSTDALLYHCTAGKDRTGLMSALILAALGVDENKIRQDYLLSNYYRHPKIERFTRLGARFMGIENESIRSVLEVRPEYLQASFDYIDQEYGNMMGYLQNGVGLSKAEVFELRSRYLE